MKWIIGDVHGCFLTLKKLIKTIEEKDSNPEFIFCGDLIDRGPRSAEVVDFVIDGIKNKGFKAVKGNHEQMLYEYTISPFSAHYISQGGRETLKSYENYYSTDEEADKRILSDIEFLMELPYFIEFKEKDSKGRRLVVSHAVCNDFHDEFTKLFDDRAEKLSEEHIEQFEKENGILARCRIFKYHEFYTWNRELPNDEIDIERDIFSISGHNITNHLIQVNGTENYDPDTQVILNEEIGYACIDTGCFVDSQEKGFGGVLTAMSFPEKEIIQISNID